MNETNIFRYIYVSFVPDALVSIQRPRLRGPVKVLVMDALTAGPIHGYGLLREIARRTRGLHTPSPGSIYPALRWLTRRGYLSSLPRGRCTVYRLTREGRRYLEELRTELGQPARLYELEHGTERATLMQELRETTRLVAANLQALALAQTADLRNVVARMRRRVIDMLALPDLGPRPNR